MSCLPLLHVSLSSSPKTTLENSAVVDVIPLAASEHRLALLEGVPCKTGLGLHILIYPTHCRLTRIDSPGRLGVRESVSCVCSVSMGCMKTTDYLDAYTVSVTCEDSLCRDYLTNLYYYLSFRPLQRRHHDEIIIIIFFHTSRHNSRLSTPRCVGGVWSSGNTCAVVNPLGYSRRVARPRVGSKSEYLALPRVCACR